MMASIRNLLHDEIRRRATQVKIQRRGRPEQVNVGTEVEFSGESGVAMNQDAEDSTVEGSD
jgi:hypothetical protein